MGRRRRWCDLAAGLVVVLVLLTMATAAAAAAEEHNKTSAAGEYITWSSSDVVGIESSSSEEVSNDDQLDGGFSSLDGMLQWAIGYSDPAKLHSEAQNIQKLSSDELLKRRMELKEVLETLKTPSDAQLMQIAINDLNNISLPLEDHHRALEELLVLVEPIDNANDFDNLGGLAVVTRELTNSDPWIRRTSAWILGKACQNNPLVQKQVIELGALAKLMVMAKSYLTEEAIKALYAISALIRNNVAGQELFYAEGGALMLQEILCNTSIDIKLRKKSLLLVADLVEFQLEARYKVDIPLFGSHFFFKSLVDLTASVDIDLQEKALIAIRNLLLLGSTECLISKDYCGLPEALERMRLQLMVEESNNEYAVEVESLRREVNLIFLEKINRGSSVPT